MHALHASYSSKHFTWINSFNPHNNPVRCVLLLSPTFVHEELGYREITNLVQGHIANIYWGLTPEQGSSVSLYSDE